MGHKEKILIVDDEPLNVKLMKANLSDARYETVFAYSGEEALDKVIKESPDIILLDIMMPGMSGYEVTERLKGNAETRDIPVILITALDGADNKIKGLECGADEFLNKPVNTAELRARVNSLLRLRQYQNQLKLHRESKQLVINDPSRKAAVFLPKRPLPPMIRIFMPFLLVLEAVTGHPIIARCVPRPESAL